MKKGQAERVTLSVVRDAFFRGDFEGCLALCDGFEPRDAKDAAEILLLRARCLISLGRGEHAIHALRGLRTADRHHDEFLTGRMLMSAAYMSIGQDARGLEIALEAYGELGDAHPTVRAELLVTLAVGHYRKGEHVRAQRLLDSVPNDADIVYVRALEYSGWLAWARGDYTGSVERFRDALRRIDACGHYDRFIEAKCLFGLAFLSAELLRLDLWSEIGERVERFDWSVSGVATWRYWIADRASVIAELRGDLDGSTTWAATAEEIAPDTGARINAWCRLAARFGRYGEAGAHGYFVSKARDAYEALPRNARHEEQRSLPLVIADEIVNGASPDDAGALLTYFEEAVVPTMLERSEDRRAEAFYASILGQYEERRGNRRRAQEAYVRAFEAFRSVGFLRHAAITAYRLTVLTGDDGYRTFADHALREASPLYWVKARLAKSRTEVRLTRRQLEVLRLVAEGRSNKEIAKACGIAYHTARNTVSKILGLLGVESRTELAGVAAALSLLRPENGGWG
jgi:DNA-binding CsgD family transcriptional regulator